MNEHDLDLLHREVDGLTTDAENERLRSLLESDHELRVAHDELQAVKVAFAAFQEKEPPPGLKDAIMRALPEQPPEVVSAPPRSWWAALTDRILTPRPVTLAYAFALGVVVAFAVSTTFIPAGNIDAGDVVGAMGATDPYTNDTPREYPFSSNGVAGSVGVWETDDHFHIAVTWDAEGDIVARITFDERALSVARTENVKPAERLSTSTAPGVVELVGSGSIEHVVSFAKIGSGYVGVQIVIESNGEPVLDMIEAPRLIEPN